MSRAERRHQAATARQKAAEFTRVQRAMRRAEQKKPTPLRGTKEKK